MSKGFFPGRNDAVHTSGVQVTCFLVNPSWLATAYATADSYPWPLYGFEIFHGFFSAPPKKGGNAGLSVPMVSVPSFSNVRVLLLHPGIADGDDDPPVAVAASASASTVRARPTKPVRIADHSSKSGLGGASVPTVVRLPCRACPAHRRPKLEIRCGADLERKTPEAQLLRSCGRCE